MKRRFGILLATGALLAVSGCVYTPGYYARPGVVYDDGTAVYAPAPRYADGGGYAPGYYADPPCCYGGWWPWVGLNFYGAYSYGSHWHGGHGWHSDGSHHAAPRPLPGGHAGIRGGPSHGH